MGFTSTPASILFGALALLGTVQAVPFPNGTITRTTRLIVTPTQTGTPSIITPTSHAAKPKKGAGIMGTTPKWPSDINTIEPCEFWWDNDGSFACTDMPDLWGISLEWFIQMNPSIKSDCTNFKVGWSYCVQAERPSSTSELPTSTTTTGNGIETPTPTQDGMVDNCNKFYFVAKGDTCDKIAAKQPVTAKQIIEWNSSVGPDCSEIWANVNICIGIIGGPTTTKDPESTTTKGNGITTPTPTQDQIVDNCNKFYKVEKGQTCDKVASINKITSQQIIEWNPSVGADCTGLIAGAHACVGIIGGPTTTTTTTTTTTGNGIATPTPSQPGMVDNCDQFHKVSSGETCASIGAWYGVWPGRIGDWNGVGSDCKGIWANAHMCVHTIGYKPIIGNQYCYGTNDPEWGGNFDSAYRAVDDWCDGKDNYDGHGQYVVSQEKWHCYPAADGRNYISLWARNIFGVNAYLHEDTCRDMMKAVINSCGRGGQGSWEGWEMKAWVTPNPC